LKVTHFEHENQKYANIYLNQDETNEQYKDLIDLLIKDHKLAIFHDGDADIISTMKQLLTTY
jgi:hypothetical protein